MARAFSQLGRLNGKSSMVLYGIMFSTAYLPCKSATMPSISSSPSLTPSIRVHWYCTG